MRGLPRSRWRRLIYPSAQALTAALAAAAAFGCRADLTVWRADLAAAGAPRLVGLWAVRIQREPVDAGTLPPPGVQGEIALTLNEQRLSGSGFDGPPMLVGTYDVDLAPLGLGAGADAGGPGVVVRLRGDSVYLDLGLESKLPIELRGVLLADSIVGRWTAYARAGPGGAGSFLLRRR